MPPPARQIVDSLWRCLCPSFSSHFSRSIRGRQSWQPELAQRRCISSQIHLQQNTKSIAEKHKVGQQTTQQQQKPGRLSRDEVFEQQRQLFLRNHKDATVEKLEEALHEAAIRGERQQAWDLMEMLIADRGVKPTVRHYASLIEANCSIHDGSLEEVHQLWEELQEQGLQPDQTVYEALLKVLAIHPSYTLRTAVVDAMRGSGMAIKKESQVHIICGLLRDRQIELALEELERLRNQDSRPPAWLMDVIIHTLADIGEFDELYPLLLERSEDIIDRPSQILYLNVLSKAAKSLHHSTVSFIWSNEVSKGCLNPSSGLCTLVLDTAARAGDPALATDVFRVLGDRSSPLTTYQYEALIEAHMASESPDLQKVFTILIIMSQSNSVELTDQTTRPIFEYLRKRTGTPEEAFELLRTLKKQGYTCPVEVANAIIDAAIYQGKLDWVFEVYKQLHKVIGSSGTLFTFNILLRGCYKAHRKNLAMFVAAEMVALNVAPDALTYDRLILASIHGNEGSPEASKASLRERREQDIQDLDDAFRYLAEMRDRNWWPRKGTLNLLGQKAIECQDNRVHDLIEWMESIGTDADIIKASLR